MNILLWVLQALAAPVYGASGCIVLGVLMAFVAYGRMVQHPIF